MTDDQKTVYAIGLTMYKQLTQLSLSPAEIELVRKGLGDAAAGKPAVDLETWGPKIETLARTRAGIMAEKEKAASKAYLAKCAAEPGAIKTPSGLVYRDLKVGTGVSPKASDMVKVQYRGTLVNGTEFDSSYKHGQPLQIPLSSVIPCWTEGVQKMKAGGKARLVCPSEIGYGERGSPPTIGPGATLIFEIELLDVGAH